MPAPLFAKYSTKSGTKYVYDLGTGKIVKVGSDVFDILDNFGLVDDFELEEIYSDWGKERVHEAVHEVHVARAAGVLADHDPIIPERATGFVTDGGEVDVLAKFNTSRGVLVLGVTERCNLRCEYCPFGEHYPRFREHGEDDMPQEVAERAIIEHVASSQNNVMIAFYGGEPFLNFDLVKHCIEFAEKHTRAAGKQNIFSITTNGTLYTDEKIHFLVEHNVSVATSLDGAKQAHDRYRIFQDKHGSGRRVGSFDLIMKNLRRFVELYPNYRNRGIFVVLARPFDLVESQKLIDDLWPHFPLSRVSFVNTEYGSTVDSLSTRPKQVGCAPAAQCGKSGSDAGPAMPAQELGGLPILQKSSSGSSCSSGCGCSETLTSQGGSAPILAVQDSLPVVERRDTVAAINEGVEEELANREAEEKRQVRACVEQFKQSRIEHGAASGKRDGFVNLAFKDFVTSIHTRPIDASRRTRMVNYKCFPGVVRLFCDIRGRYFTCERCETTDTLALGNVWTGMDARHSERLMELYRHVADCGNCIAQRHCTNCFTSFFQKPAEESGIVGDAYDARCREIRLATPVLFSMYTEIMEGNVTPFDNKVLEMKGGETVTFDPCEGQVDIGVEYLDVPAYC